MFRIVMSTFALSVAALLCAGCGGGSSSGQSVSKAQFIKQGDQICTKADQAQLAGLKELQQEQHVEALEDRNYEEKVITQVGLPPLRAEHEELSQLTLPTDGEKQAQEVIEDLGAAIEKAEAEPHLLLEPGKNPFEPVESLAVSFGFKSCGKA
jgi:hypothetical protein